MKLPLLRSWALVLLSLAATLPSQAAAADLDQNFSNPPDSARPWVYWFWLNANGTLKKWPQWLLDGQATPSIRPARPGHLAPEHGPA